MKQIRSLPTSASRRRSWRRRSTGTTSSDSGWLRRAARDGKLAITLPIGDAKLPGIAAEDIGRSAYGIFKKGPELIGKRIGIAGEHLSGSEMAAAFTNLFGEEVRYNAVEPSVYRGFGFPGSEDLGNMFQFKRDFETDFRAARPVDETRALNPQLLRFSEWLAANRDRIGKS